MIDAVKETNLLAICKSSQGEYIPAFHGRGSFATTYSNEFISAAMELYKMYCYMGKEKALYALGKNFRENGISSCRGAVMNADRVKYFFETHIEEKL